MLFDMHYDLGKAVEMASKEIIGFNSIEILTLKLILVSSFGVSVSGC